MASTNTRTRKAPTSPQPPADEVAVTVVDVVSGAVLDEITVSPPVVKSKGGRKANPLTAVSAEYAKAKAALAKVEAKIAAQSDLTAEHEAAKLWAAQAKTALDEAYAALTA